MERWANPRPARLDATMAGTWPSAGCLASVFESVAQLAFGRGQEGSRGLASGCGRDRQPAWGQALHGRPRLAPTARGLPGARGHAQGAPDVRVARRREVG